MAIILFMQVLLCVCVMLTKQGPPTHAYFYYIGRYVIYIYKYYRPDTPSKRL